MNYDPIKNFSLIEIEAIENQIKTIDKKSTNHKKTFISMLMPPPNVTGKLHLGHALNNYIQDSIIRWYRLRGHQTLWIPGFDHAGIATEILVNKWIKQNHFLVTSKDDRKYYFDQWVTEQTTNIRQQWEKMNLLIDYEHEMFTLNKTFKKAVTTAFVKLYQDGLIYQAEKLVNWDPKLKTAISDIEVSHREKKGILYFFKYFSTERKSKFLTIATTRPETMYADQAVVVHPDDDRYKKWIGQKVINPINNEEIPVFASNEINPDFGTGVLKCTPGHDFFDFRIAQKNKLKMVLAFDESGNLKKIAGKLAGIDRLKARPMVVQILKNLDAFVKEQTHTYAIPFSNRSGAIIEPFLTKQWFIKTKKWAKNLINKKKEINFFPKKYQQSLWKWLENIQDWCISRQLSWGHRLPIYKHKITEEIKISETPMNDEWIQSSDVLDTWFSSGLWSLVNFGWNNEKAKKNQEFFPINFLVTSYDIIFFWVGRMLFLHNHFAKKIPFEKILIHGLVRTAQNEKMSKSKGNVIDPMELIEKFGSGGLRFYLLSNYKIGEDLVFDEEKLVQTTQFAHKLWNINSFLEKNEIEIGEKEFKFDSLDPINAWIIQKFHDLQKKVEQNFDQTFFSIGLQAMIKFIRIDWSNFYLRIAWSFLEKDILVEQTKKTIAWVWINYLALIHPFFPKLSIHLWKKMTSEELLIDTFKLPKIFKKKDLITTIFFKILEVKKINIKKIRGKMEFIYKTKNPGKITDEEKNKLNSMLYPFGCFLNEFIGDSEDRIIVMQNERKIKTDSFFYENELKRAEKNLENSEFIKNADPEIVEKERNKIEKYRNLLKTNI